MDTPTLEITFYAQLDGRHIVAAHFRASDHDHRAVATVPSTFGKIALRQASADPDAYGRELTVQLFADPDVRAFWGLTRAIALQQGALAVRLRLSPHDTLLHSLRWETLNDPEDDMPLALNQRIRLARTLDSQDLALITQPPRSATLTALIAVAAPGDHHTYRLAQIDADGEVSRARAALGSIAPTILGDVPGATSRATLEGILREMETEPTIAILIAHGRIDTYGKPILYLENEAGQTEPIPGEALINGIGRLPRRPRLLILVSCKGAGDDYQALTSIGPRLAQQGIPAVLAFQGDIAMAATKRLLPHLIASVLEDGLIDRALASARTAFGREGPFWQPVLFLKGDGRLWRASSQLPVETSTEQRRLDAAMPSKTTVGNPTEVWVQVCLKDSQGFRERLPLYTRHGDEITRADLHESEFSITFPTGADGKVLPAELRVEIRAPDFAVVEYVQNTLLLPQRDTALMIFTVTPTSARQRSYIHIIVKQVYPGGKALVVASASVETSVAGRGAGLVKDVVWNLVSIGLAARLVFPGANQMITNEAPNPGAQGVFHAPLTFNKESDATPGDPVHQKITVSGGKIGSIIGSRVTEGTAPTGAGSERAEAVAHQQKLLAAHRATLAHYLALAGAAPARPEIVSGISAARAGIAQAKLALAALGAPAADLPGDVE